MYSPAWAFVAMLVGSAADDAGASRPSSELASYLAVVRISEQLLRPLTSREIVEHTPVRQMILGTLATGSARTQGEVLVDLHKGNRPFCFSVVFTGTTYARTVARNGPAVIHSDASTRFTAAKTIDFDYERGFAASPPRISATTTTRALSVRSTLPGVAGCLVKRVAWRRIHATRGQVNAIASRNAEQRIVHSFDGEVQQAVGQLNADFALLKPALAPYFEQRQEPVITFWTSDTHLKIAVARPRETYERPELPDDGLGSSLLQIWLHQALLENESAPPQTEWVSLQRSLAPFRETYRTLVVRFYLPRGTPGLLAIADRWIVISLGEEGVSADR